MGDVKGHRLVARVDGGGLRWPEELIDALNSDTGLEWTRDDARETREAGPTQGGVEQIILNAAVGAVGEMVLKALLEQARETVDRFGKHWLERLRGTVEPEQVDPDDTDDPGENVATGA